MSTDTTETPAPQPEGAPRPALSRRAQDMYLRVREENPLGEFYQDNPYRAMALAAAAGYVLAGGVFTPFTRFLLRMGVRAVVIPMAVAQIQHLAKGPDDL